MLLEAEKRLHIDLPKSFIVGDRLSDILAGRAAGLVRGALVSTGYGAGEWQRHQALARQWSETHAFELEHSPTATEAIYSWLDRLPVS